MRSASSRLSTSPWPRGKSPPVTFAFVFVLLALQAFLLAWTLKSVVAAWLGMVSLFVGIAYVRRAPHWFGKKADGRLPLHTWLLWAPHLGLSWLTYTAFRAIKRERASDLVAPRIYVGRRPRTEEIPKDVTLVIDLCAELPTHAHIRDNYTYLALPTLDGTEPTVADIERAIVAFRATEGAAYVHCAFGHGRSATIAAALILDRGEGQAETVEAEMRKARGGIRMSGPQRAQLRAWAASRKQIDSAPQK